MPGSVQTFLEELRQRSALTEYQRRQLDVVAQFLVYDREPVDRIVVDLAANAGKQYKLGPGFWLYVKQGCGHNLVKITFGDSPDATHDAKNFPVQVGECWNWPFSEATITIPTGITSGTITFEKATQPIPCRYGTSVQELKNRTSFSTFQKTVAVAGTAERLVAAALLLPDGHPITIKAKWDNTGKIRLGNSAANAQSTTASYTLEPGETVDLAIDDVNKIFIDAEVALDGVECIHEAV